MRADQRRRRALRGGARLTIQAAKDIQEAANLRERAQAFEDTNTSDTKCTLAVAWVAGYLAAVQDRRK